MSLITTGDSSREPATSSYYNLFLQLSLGRSRAERSAITSPVDNLQPLEGEAGNHSGSHLPIPEQTLSGTRRLGG
jgi:hypothetical protein